VSRNRIRIPASPEDVFAVLDDACAYPRWVVGTRRIRAVDHDWPAEGSAFHHAIGTPGAELHDLSRVVHRDAPHQLVLEVKFRPTGTARVELAVDPAGGGCEVVMFEQPTSGPAARVPAFLREPLLGLRNAWSLQRLRREVERAQRDAA
jgi:uncharacterized protein YndB with AHSA1/START domain